MTAKQFEEVVFALATIAALLAVLIAGLVFDAVTYIKSDSLWDRAIGIVGTIGAGFIVFANVYGIARQR